MKYLKGIVIALLISTTILAIWYAMEYQQFRELQWNRDCDDIVWILYLFALTIGFSKW